jgi:hypothetical protein
VQSGITPGEQIIVNPPDSLTTGEPVRVVTSESKKDETDGKSGDNDKPKSDQKSQDEKNSDQK